MCFTDFLIEILLTVRVFYTFIDLFNNYYTLDSNPYRFPSKVAHCIGTCIKLDEGSIYELRDYYRPYFSYLAWFLPKFWSQVGEVKGGRVRGSRGRQFSTWWTSWMRRRGRKTRGPWSRFLNHGTTVALNEHSFAKFRKIFNRLQNFIFS